MHAYPQGDPEAVHELAAALRRAAATVDAAPHPGIEGWTSPAATRTRTVLDRAARAADRVADDLRDCAARLDASARRLADEQRTWRAARQREEQRVAEEQRRGTGARQQFGAGHPSTGQEVRP